MGWRGWFGGLFNDDTAASSSPAPGLSNHGLGCQVNPATGLPMVGGCGGLDVAGNPYGTSSSYDWLNSSHAFPDHWLSTHTSTSFNDD